jgi:hypothetical protein
LPSKKDFKLQNPALRFIADTETAGNPPEELMDKYTHTDTHAHIISPRGEIKSRRVQLLLRPSTYEAIAALARTNNASVNDAINTILENFVRTGK